MNIYVVTVLVVRSNRINAPNNNGQFLGADLYRYHCIRKHNGLTLDVKYTINLLYIFVLL